MGDDSTQDGKLDERVTRLQTPQECERFAANVEKRLPLLASQARRKAIELKAAEHRSSTTVEREALAAVYAYERVLSSRAGKTIRASRTWQMIDRHGILPAVERAVDREDDPSGYTALVELGMEDLSFEAVVLRHPESFSEEARARASQRCGDRVKPLDGQ